MAATRTARQTTKPSRRPPAGRGAAAKHPPAGPTPRRLAGMAWAYAAPLVVEAAIHLRIFDVLDAGPLTVDQIAAATRASRRGVRALADALVGVDLLARRGERYSLTPESAAFLVRGKPGWHGAMFEHTAGQVLPHWLRLTDVARAGRPEHAMNVESQGAEFFAGFVEALFGTSIGASRALAAALGTARAKAPVSVLDLAAGSGVWGIGLAQASPQVRVTAVDWEGVLPVTRRVAEREGVADRFTFVAGDMHKAPFGRGHDVATLGHILHSEGETRSRALLAKVARSLAKGGTIAIAEFLADDDRRGPPVPLFFAVNMLLHTEHGDVFTFREIASWLRDAGFRRVRKLAVPSPSPLILATRA